MTQPAFTPGPCYWVVLRTCSDPLHADPDSNEPLLDKEQRFGPFPSLSDASLQFNRHQRVMLTCFYEENTPCALTIVRRVGEREVVLVWFGAELPRFCRQCGCTEEEACLTEEGPCRWVELDLCSACAKKSVVRG